MIETTTTDQPVATKRGRNRAVILTDRMCEKRVDERIKILRPQMPRPLCQHHCCRGRNLLLQVHRQEHRQAAHGLARRL
jgi:hypothetical protein